MLVMCLLGHFTSCLLTSLFTESIITDETSSPRYLGSVSDIRALSSRNWCVDTDPRAGAPWLHQPKSFQTLRCFDIIRLSIKGCHLHPPFTLGKSRILILAMESSARKPGPEDQAPCIPTHSAASPTLRCCCGRNDCAFLHHNNVALEGLEKDLATAARLGQVRSVPLLRSVSLEVNMSINRCMHKFHSPACVKGPPFCTYILGLHSGSDIPLTVAFLCVHFRLALWLRNPSAPLSSSLRPVRGVEPSGFFVTFVWLLYSSFPVGSHCAFAVMAAASDASVNFSSLTFSLQALLHRHESYMAEAEEDRHHLLTSIENLEREKRQVQEENARIIEENRGLLVQLDELNRAVADSDSRAKSLAASLESTEAELRKVTAAAARAGDLEAQLARMENEQSRLQDSLQLAQEGSKSAVQRWKQAEATLRNLHDQVDQIEKEAREERERHADLIQRMERRRAVERELDGAAGRLKGAAAAQELTRNQGGTVVSRFVRDILQDNANLQMGIVELREMLESSNQEVQSLREQILSHQPLVSTGEGDGDAEHQRGTTLCQELESHESRRVSQEFHIHHHYHTPPVPVGLRKEKATALRRTRKRRSLGNSSTLHSASGTPSSRKTRHRSQSSTSSTSTILSQTSVSIPPTSRPWSLQSPATDSIASSPQSAYRTSSIFDRAERGFESSRATSPESTVFLSPLRGTRHKSPVYDGGFQSFEALLSYGIADNAHDEFVDYHEYSDPEDRAVQPAIPEEEDSSLQYTASERACSPAPNEEDDVFAQPYRSMRKTSHESLFSVAGMDIHTPSHHPSRLSGVTSALPIRTPRRILSSGSDGFSVPVIATTPITADREPSKLDQSPRSLLASMAASSAGADSPSRTMQTAHSESTVMTPRTSSLGRRVGGWVRGRWGTAPTPSDSPGRTPRRDSLSSASSVSSKETNSSMKAKTQASSTLRFRYPGVNQSGPIMGFRPPPRAPARVHAETIDEGLLRESLEE